MRVSLARFRLLAASLLPAGFAVAADGWRGQRPTLHVSEWPLKLALRRPGHALKIRRVAPVLMRHMDREVGGQLGRIPTTVAELRNAQGTLVESCRCSLTIVRCHEVSVIFHVQVYAGL
jgi:hypothetical protein